MSITTSYLEADTALAALQQYDDSLTSSDITTFDIGIAEGRVNVQLEHARIDIPATDHGNYLLFASFFFLIDYMSQAGKIATTTGRVIISELGKAKTKYNKENMFFMRTGDVRRPLIYLRDAATPSQAAMEFVEAYKKWYFRDSTGTYSVSSKMSYDITPEGFGANMSTDEIDDAIDESAEEDYYP